MTQISRICLCPGALGGGGIGRVFLNLSAEFAALGIDVDMVLTSDRHDGREQEIPEGVRIVNLGSRSRYSLFAAVRYFRANRPQMIVSAHDYVNLLMWCARLISGTRRESQLVWTYHTRRSVELAFTTKLGRFYDWLARTFSFAPDTIVAVSDGVAADIADTLGIPKSRINMIHNPAWSADMARRASMPTDHPWLVQKAFPVVIGVGRLTRQKDFPTLIMAFERLQKLRQARLIILGEGEDRALLERLTNELDLAEVVDLPGHVANPLAVLSRADVFVLSSAWEGFGNVIVEALGCGLGIVSTDCMSGPAEILDQGRFGKLVPVGDVSVMADAILEVLENPPDKAEQIIAAKRFDNAIAARAYLKLHQ